MIVSGSVDIAIREKMIKYVGNFAAANGWWCTEGLIAAISCEYDIAAAIVEVEDIIIEILAEGIPTETAAESDWGI